MICEVFPNAEITSFDDGDKAWDALTKQSPDLFIFDDEHPGIRGREIVRRLVNRKAQLPMIFATGACEEVLPPIHEFNIKVLQKPFHHEELLKVIRQLGIRNPN